MNGNYANMPPQARIMKEISPEWQQLMEIVERVGYGEVTIKVNNGKPEMVETAVKQIKLGLSDEDFKKRMRIVPLL